MFPFSLAGTEDAAVLRIGNEGLGVWELLPRLELLFQRLLGDGDGHAGDACLPGWMDITWGKLDNGWGTE